MEYVGDKIKLIHPDFKIESLFIKLAIAAVNLAVHTH